MGAPPVVPAELGGPGEVVEAPGLAAGAPASLLFKSSVLPALGANESRQGECNSKPLDRGAPSDPFPTPEAKAPRNAAFSVVQSAAFGGPSCCLTAAGGDGGERDNGGLLSESFFDPAAANSPSASSDVQHATTAAVGRRASLKRGPFEGAPSLAERMLAAESIRHTRGTVAAAAGGAEEGNNGGSGGPQLPAFAFQRSCLSVRLGELVRRAMREQHKVVWMDRSDARGLLPLPGLEEEGTYLVWTEKGADVLVEIQPNFFFRVLLFGVALNAAFCDAQHVLPSYLCPVSCSSRERQNLRPFLVLSSASLACLFEGVLRRQGVLVYSKPKVVSLRTYTVGKKSRAALAFSLPEADAQFGGNPAAAANQSHQQGDLQAEGAGGSTSASNRSLSQCQRAETPRAVSPSPRSAAAVASPEGRKGRTGGPPTGATGAPPIMDMQLHYLTKKGRVIGEDYVFYRRRTCDDEGAALYNLSVSVKRQPKTCSKHHFRFDALPPKIAIPKSAETPSSAVAAAAAEDEEDAGTVKAAAAESAAAELQPLAAEAEALQQLELEKERYILERDRGGWRGWVYAEDNCDLGGYDAALQLPAALASEIRVLLGLQPSIMAHRCK
ncbi:set domain-containing protein [Cyclospora cayetanensis]|uniref:Set domain-containing protein n=1 Tax=Cyclospora cayetanensis TaxID=88456 RepID=A0A1D3D3V2_9EIME|nr:set domain-containing protein [Cyclospora cayetanensis]